jgi:hypothetical protein
MANARAAGPKAHVPARPIPRIHARLEAVRRASALIDRELGAIEEELRQFTLRDLRRAATLARYLSYVPKWMDRSAERARAMAAKSSEVLGAIPAASMKKSGHWRHGLRVLAGGRA